MTTTTQNRIGFHYYPDQEHFREQDLHTWLPRLQKLGAGWLTISAPEEIAVPEPFIHALIQAGIEPILQLKLPVSAHVNPMHMQMLIEAYAKWGVRYLAIHERPNVRSTWQSPSWVRFDLVERFLDQYIPLAEMTRACGMKPVFPPLHPGGDYWDTAFLRTALTGLVRRDQHELLDTLVLSAYAWMQDRPLSWGAGGPERWPGARPYYTPQGQQDQRGLYIFDWYLTLCQAVLGETRPIILFETGREPPEANGASHTPNPSRLAEKMLATYQLIEGDYAEVAANGECLEPLPDEVIAANMWLLASASNSPFQSEAWYQTPEKEQPVVLAVQSWLKDRDAVRSYFDPYEIPKINGHPIHHYVLLPRYEWGIADWHLEAIRPYLKKYQPTVGYSLDEALLAARVTVIGGPQTFPEADLDVLRQAGCEVERISGDGMSIATHLERA